MTKTILAVKACLLSGICPSLVAGLLAVAVYGPVPAGAAEPDRRVVLAAKADDLPAVRRLITARAPVNTAEGDGTTALLWAAYHSNLDMARALLAARADVRATNQYGVSPLLQASRLGHAPLMELLIKAGADPQGAHPEGETPLMAAAYAGSLEGLKLLLARGVDVDAAEAWQGQTALMWAAGEGHLDIVKTLLEAGANPRLVARPSTLAHRPTAFRGRSFVDFPTGGLTALMVAAREGHIEVARALVEGGADLDVANPDGATALMVAVINDRTDLAAMLLDRGANADDGSLFQAVEMHNIAPDATAGEATRPRLDHVNTVTTLQLIERLVARGANPNKVFDHTLHLGQTRPPQNPRATAFYRAAQSGDVDSLRLMAAKVGNAEVATAGATGFQVDGAAGVTPLMAAIPAGGGRGGGGGPGGGAPRFREPGTRNAVEAVKVILGTGANVNAEAANGDTALHRAARSGNLEIIQILADGGARLDVANKAGFTPLDVALGKEPVPENPFGGGGGPGRGGARPGQPAAAELLQKLMGQTR